MIVARGGPAGPGARTGPRVVGVILVRHAHAGAKKLWSGPDDGRPLSPLGHEQARSLTTRLSDDTVAVVWSSPAVRCLQTVEALATDRGLEVRTTELLAKDGSTEALVAWLAEGGVDAPWLLCSHGEVLEALHHACVAAGLEVFSPTGSTEKGAAWRLGAAREYLAPEPPTHP